jgi:ketosteroid isomerase-like protein
MSQENLELVRRGFQAFLGGHWETRAETLTDDFLSEFFDPEVEWHPIPQGVLAGGTYVGFEGLRRFWTDFFAAWDEISAVPEEFWEADDLVAVRVQMRGRMQDIEVDETWSLLFTLRNARVMRIDNFSTPDGALEAAGLSE